MKVRKRLQAKVVKSLPRRIFKYGGLTVAAAVSENDKAAAVQFQNV